MASLRLATKRIPTHSIGARSVSTSSSSSHLRTGLYTAAFAVSAGLFAVYYYDSRSAIHRYLLTPALRYALDAETSHRLAVRALGNGLGPKDRVEDDERLRAELWGITLSNPVGLAAGFDKDGEAIDAGLFDLGFSWVEIGSVTPKPQPGNPRPRVFHLPEDSALINRYGFPSQGHTSVLSRLRARLPAFFPLEEQERTPASLQPGKMLAVNLGKNKTSALESPDDFVAGVKTFALYADALVINVSSPNTPGLRYVVPTLFFAGLQKREVLLNLLQSVIHARDDASFSRHRKPKLILKIAPDLGPTELEDIAEAVSQTPGIDGVIVSNTTVQRPATLINPNKVQQGGLSGAPLQPLSLTALRTLRARLPADIPLIGCGGISTGADALKFAEAGASFIQVYTGFGYDGPGTCRRIKDELAAELAKRNTTWAEVSRKAVNELSLRAPEPKATGKEAVNVLVQQAEELKGLLDRLGERLSQDEEKVGDFGVDLAESGVSAVPSSIA
ncbi:hypothetical protein DENSPDRAFT_783707 [Dentipellis sp. KUC8613]|nr:hypothetical protein DENSPDRAFT_783707 [Dentipellis sp. KUC8613]